MWCAQSGAIDHRAAGDAHRFRTTDIDPIDPAADVAGRQMFMQDPGHPMTAALVKEFGIYPPGCHVRLASGELAVVGKVQVSLSAQRGQKLRLHMSADAIKPAHSRGKVMSSGNSVVSQSMKASANNAAAKPLHAAAVGVRPQ